VQLGQLRCMYIFHEAKMGCIRVELDFNFMVGAWQPFPSRDRAWLLRCEALMIEYHQNTCTRLDDCHWERADEFHQDLVQTCTQIGLTEYLLVILASWPQAVIRGGPMDFLPACLDEWLDFAFEEAHIDLPGQISTCGIRRMESTWNCISSNGNEFLAPQSSLLALLTLSSTSALACSRSKLLKRLLECGLNPNQRSGECCPGSISIWQVWLGSVTWN
jgi:hypothetical protein